ncbi:EAL domain-containing protein [Rhodoplanes sp. TEM]|uniref:EAL domain-containing protein n=1 Tax=Rhodoplanes tepidamans TaxID=200616 RepID=A0ABT5JDW2_RHOTP|nr:MULTISPECIES: EAL domain-containing protein [Rhodoplanes]MDC7787855.1 EAL domain-containing protein [Rhodoplanes tepidamans]MDC7985686.1 EAL domain-containing protein [Rhodoplanes sp. TEM]MDQ0357882.1 diguanylate cyclase (GGDEF)-like protein [Rhodoplanes tepidamans]
MKARRLVLPFHGLIAVAGALIGLGLLAIGLTVWGLRSDAIRVAARDSENIAHLIGDQISAAVEPLVDILDEIRERGAAVRIEDDEALRRHFGTEAVFQTLNDRLRRLPARAVIVVTDRNGVLLNSTRAWPPLAMSFADRQYVQHFHTAPASDLFISTPTESRVTGEPTLFFSKGIVDARGELVGVVAAGFEISYFERVWRAVATLAGRTFLLARTDGTILVRFPDPKRRAGERLPPHSPWYSVVAEGGGSYRGTGYFDPERRWISVSPLQRYPLVVDVAISENLVLEAWRRRSLLITVATLLAVAAAVMLLRALIVQFRSLTRSEASLAATSQELKQVNARLDTALNNMSQGLCMFDRDERLVICNERYLRMYGLTPHDAPAGITLEELLALRVSSGSFMGDTREYRARLRERLADGSRIYLQTELPDGRIVAVLNQPTPDGGWVATHEDVTERQRAAWRIAHMARHDALTDLANRLLFSERMDEAFGRLRDVGEGFALFIFDLDLFKAVNDSLGHPVGDALLKAVAERLRKHVPEDCTVGRLGGDEFAILMPGGENRRKEAARLAEMLLDVIGAPYDVDGSRVGIGISVGIALAPEDGDDTSTLLKNADLALYRAKAAGRHCCRFFEIEMDAQARMQHVLEIDLRNALARDELDVHYQVIVDVATRKPSGVEALVRWRHPVFGELPPDRFIPIAEDTGMIVALGEWILRRACTDAMSWPPHIRVAVNLSPVQFRDPGLVPTVRGILTTAGLPPQRLELEITESVLLQKHASIIAMLHELSDLGINIVLDDFGVGYSSLSYLRLFPFSKIKIDRGFVGEMTQRADCATIVSAVTSLAHALDMATTAEGVETWEQFRLVQAAGCSQAQGFLFSRPQPADQIDFSPRGSGERSHG